MPDANVTVRLSKRDIADIALACLGIWITAKLTLTSLLYLGYNILTPGGSNQYGFYKTYAILAQCLVIIVLGAINWLLLFKRSLIIDVLFPRATESETLILDNPRSSRLYEFSIRFIGLFFLLGSIPTLLPQLALALTKIAGGQTLH